MILGFGQIAPFQEDHAPCQEADDLQPAAGRLPGYGQGLPAGLEREDVLAEVQPDEGDALQALPFQDPVSDLPRDPERRFGLPERPGIVIEIGEGVAEIEEASSLVGPGSLFAEQGHGSFQGRPGVAVLG